MWLVDTNILSEVRKGARCNPGVARWQRAVSPDDIFTSVLVFGEIRRGIELLRQRDKVQAARLQDWLERVRLTFVGRTLDVSEAIADAWGRMSLQKKPVIDALMAATAQVHGLILVTRNEADVSGLGAQVLSPFEPR